MHVDTNFMLVVLGRCCRRRSPLEPHRRRKATTQPEVRRYLQHVVLGCRYLHPNQVIHRDLKLGKLFLNDDLEVKIGDLARQPKVNMMGNRRRKPCLNT